jgi:cytochrome c556
MATRHIAVGIIVLALGAGLFLSVEGAFAQKTKGKTRPAATKQLMKGIMQTNCAGLGASLKDKGPADDEAWSLAATQAACLNEMGYLLMDDGRCPDGDWANGAKALREGSAEVLAALEKKDLTAAQAAFKNTTGGCAACHKAHKPK